MKELLYVGKFYPWKECNEDDLYEALQTFDKVRICVLVGKKLRKGQPTKLLDKEFKGRVTICRFKKLKSLLGMYKENKYIMFDRSPE